jgi:hypothetical protein
MAVMTINVQSGVTKDQTPRVLSTTNTTCDTTKTIRVPVPVGETRYIQEIYSPNAVGGSSQTYTINTTTDITLTLEGQVDANEANNAFYSAYLRVSISALSEIYYTSGITRTCNRELAC